MPARRCLTRLLLCLALATALPPGDAPRAQSLVADLSHHLIAITTAFVGTTVVLFGVADKGGNIAVTVQGPQEDLVVRRKSRVAGIWVNRENLAFRSVPAYYAVASTGPLEQIARPDVLEQLEIGTGALDLEPIDATGLEPSEIASFKDALVRRMQEQGLYSREPAQINFIGDKLFRTTLTFPANVPPGIYQVQVFDLQGGFAADADYSQTGGELPDGAATVPRLEHDVVREQDDEDGDEVHGDDVPAAAEGPQDDREREDCTELDDHVEQGRREAGADPGQDQLELDALGGGDGDPVVE